VPTDDGVGLDEDESGPPARPDSKEEHPEQTVAVLEWRSGIPALVDSKLVPKGEVLKEKVRPACE